MTGQRLSALSVRLSLLIGRAHAGGDWPITAPSSSCQRKLVVVQSARNPDYSSLA